MLSHPPFYLILQHLLTLSSLKHQDSTSCRTIITTRIAETSHEFPTVLSQRFHHFFHFRYIKLGFY